MSDLIKDLLGEATANLPVNSENEEATANLQEGIEEESKEQKSKDEPVNGIITAEFAAKYKLSPSLVGKPMDELGKSYANLNRDYSRKGKHEKEIVQQQNEIVQQQHEIAQLKETINQIKEGMSKQEKQEVKEVIEDIPDPIENPDKFKEYMRIYSKNKINESEITQKVLEAVAKQFAPLLNEIKQQKSNQELNFIKSEIQKFAPEGNPEELIIAWAQESELEQEDIDYYDKHPNKLLTAIKQYYSLKQYEVDKLNAKRETGDRAVKTLADSIENSKDKKGSNLNSIPRQNRLFPL